MPDPHVYPDPQIAPLFLPAAVGVPAATYKDIEQLAAPDATTPWIPKTMFIRVAMSGATVATPVGPSAPDFYLIADTGDPVLINDHMQPSGVTYAIFRLAGTNLPDYVADGSVVLESNNVFLITVSFQDAAGSYAWQLGIRNNDPASAREFTWVVSATLANTAQPWIDVEPATLSWDVLVGGSAGESVQINNKGTATFTVTGLSAALPADFSLDPLPGAVIPNASASLTIHFTGPPAPPAPDGVTAATAMVNITPADTTALTAAGHNQQLSVSALTQSLEVMLLLDDSGSMGWDPLGNPLPAGSSASRWSELADAVNNHFLNLLGFFGQSRGNFGIARFPATDPLNPATYDLVNPTPIPNAAGMAAAQEAVAAVLPFNGTPMGDGIDHVFAPATSHFASDPLSIAANRRWLLLMTDGAWNSGTHNPMEYVLPAFGGTAAAGTSLSDKKVALFAIGYGITGHSDVNPTVLQNLAAGSYLGGQVRRPDDDGLMATEVAGAFRDAIKSGISPLSSPGDPPAVFHAGQAEARHFALITHYDHKAAFVLGWNTPDASRLRLELITPTCDLITPENAGKGVFKDIVFRGGNRSHMYMAGPDFLRNAADPARPRYGTWTLRVLSPELSDAHGGLEHYDYDIIVDSDLRMTVKLDRASYYAGDPIRVSARLTAAGKPITGASVTLSTTAPQQSEANWLAGLDVPAEFLKRAAEMVRGDSTAILIKKVAAGLAGMVFPGGRAQCGTAMTDAAGIGTYEAVFTNTSMPETYTFYITATGVTEDGTAFRREGKCATNVLVRPEPAFTKLLVEFGAQGLSQAVVVPRDRFGNVLLVDPASLPGFGLTIQGGRFTGALISQVNGTYTQSFTVTPGAVPVIGATFGGQTVQQQTVPPIADLVWVDEVLAFVRGAEAAPGANQHTDPKDALGDPRTKSAGEFVSLGAGGSLTVGVHGQFILAQGDADVTVFVQPDDDLRPYLVEALREHGHGHERWVALGTSTGTTASFRLQDANIESTRAVRITDRSSRTRGKNLQPLATPGVSIRAVGVGKAGSSTGEGGICIRIRALNPERRPLGGTVDVEFKPHEAGETIKVSAADASKDIDVRGLQRTPRGLYQVTVIPTDVFRPASQFVNIPTDGFNTVEFIIDKRPGEKD